MTAGTDSHPNDPHVEALGKVRQVTLPLAARTLSTLSHVDYEDAFLVETGPAQDRTAGQWARAILEDAPMSTRNALSRGWSALGLRLGSTQSDRFVLGLGAPAQHHGHRAPWHQRPPRVVGRTALRTPAAHTALRHLRTTGEPHRTRTVGRNRAPAPTGRAGPPRAGQLPGTAPAPAHGGGIAIDYVDFLRFSDHMYVAGTQPIKASRLGRVITHIRCSLAAEEDQRHAGPPLINGTTSFLAVRSAIYQVRGYVPRCRLAAIASLIRVTLARRSPVPPGRA